MDSSILGGIIGGGVGVLGVAAGVWAALWGMGVNEYLGGKKRKSLNSPIGKEELKTRLAALNSTASPYELKPSDRSDFMLEWKIVDANWSNLFAKEHLKETYRAFLLLDEQRTSVRYYEESASVQWSAGVGAPSPSVTFREEFFKGRYLFQKSVGVQYGFKNVDQWGKVFQYSFDINSVRNPIKQMVEESGWEFVPVVRKSHATYRSLNPAQ